MGKKNEKFSNFSELQRIYGKNSENYASESWYNKERSVEPSGNVNRSTYDDYEFATAPYNFVPLNDVVVQTEWEIEKRNDLSIPCIPSFAKFDDKLYNGYIELEIKNLTALYIRRVKSESESDGLREEEKEFFRIGEKYKIPGSSLRGMVRTLIEIVSYGKFVNSNINRKLYFRNLSLEKYRKKFTNTEGTKVEYKVIPGILFKENGKYKIKYFEDAKNFYRIKNSDINYIASELRDSESNFKNKTPKNYKVYFKQIFFEKPQNIERTIRVQYSQFSYKEGELDKNKISNEQKKGYVKGFLIITGLVPNKTHQWVIEIGEDVQVLEISEEVIKSYRQDSTKAFDIFEFMELTGKKEIPVFFLKDANNEVVALGHTPFFRVSYEKLIKDHIKTKDLIDDSIIDIPEAIFGSEKGWASRVFFEDLELENEPEFYEETSPQILSSPKPTCYQHYLEQDEELNKKEKRERVRMLKDWDSDAKIRGYKLYWHRLTGFSKQSINDEKYKYWNEGEKCKDSQHTVIKALKEGKKFRGRIRFQNLSEIELGALLFVLDLPKGCYHKLGMGKPLGLGTVEIKSTLKLVNRKERYKKLFENGNWYLAEKICENGDEANKDFFKRKFEEYILKKIANYEDKSSLWDTERLKKLKIMLSFDHKMHGTVKWLKLTRYMTLEKFKERYILPSPETILKNIVDQ